MGILGFRMMKYFINLTVLILVATGICQFAKTEFVDEFKNINMEHLLARSDNFASKIFQTIL